MARKSGTKKQKLILILCEDKKSFPDYIKHICNKIGYRKRDENLISRKSGYKIEVEHSQKTNPFGIISKAKQRAGEYDKIYCVFDYDGNNQGRKQDYQKAMNLQTAKNIEKINSVYCYEIWLLLHFKYTSKPYSNCDEIGREIEKLIREENGFDKQYKYMKSSLFSTKLKNNRSQNLKLADMFYDKIETAKTNAKRLTTDKKNHEGDIYYPSTKIANLIADFSLLDNF